MHLLYVEDNLQDQKIFKRLARQLESFTFDLADSIEAALSCLSTQRYDLVLSDFWVRQQEATHLLPLLGNTPAVILAGEAFPGERGLPPVFVGVFPKPLSLDHLAHLLQSEVILQPHKTRSLPEFDRMALDFSFLKKARADGSEDLHELLSLFVETGIRSHASIQEALLHRQWNQLQLEIHQLQSNLRIFGLKDLLTLAEEIEERCLFLHEKDFLSVLTQHFLQGLKKSLDLASHSLQEMHR